MRRRSDGLTAAGRTEDDRELLQDSYWRQAGIVIGVFWFPPSGHPPHILILWSQPTGIRDISSPPSRMLSVQQQNTERWLPENNDLCWAQRQPVKCWFLYMLWPVVALACDGSVTLRETVCLTAGRLQFSGAARHMQQILRIFFTQHFWGSTVSTTRSKLVTLKHKEIYMRKIRSIVVSFPVKSRYKWFKWSKWSKWSKSTSGIWFCWAWLCFSSLHESTYAD